MFPSKSFILSRLLLLLAGSAAAFAGRLADPVIYYPFDAAPGAGDGVVNQADPTQYGGTLYGPVLTPEAAGNSLAFDGGTAFLRCGRKGVPEIARGDFSVDFWVRLDRLVAGGVLGQKGEGPEELGWVVEATAEGNLSWKASDGSASHSVEVPLAEPSRWNHVAFVRTGGEVVVYLNGDEVAREASPVFAGDLHNPEVHLNLGRLIGKHRSFAGRLDEVVVRARALTQEEARQSWEKTRSAMTGADTAQARKLSDGPLVHYRFDENPGNHARDLSGHGHDGVIADAEFVSNVNGRKGALRFDGEKASLNIGNPPALQFGGDISFEIRMRLNRELNRYDDFDGGIFGEYPAIDRLRFGWSYFDNLFAGYGQPRETNFLPMERRLVGKEWVHVAVVFEHPRARYYIDGKLVRDQIMLLAPSDRLPGKKFLGGEPAGTGPKAKPAEKLNGAPVDIAEFRLYRRALSAEEIAAHAEEREAAVQPTEELAIEPNWYKGEATVRLVSKGRDLEGQRAVLMLQPVGGEGQKLGSVKFEDRSGNRSLRYVAEWTLPLATLEGSEVAFRAGVEADGSWQANRTARLARPEWIAARSGVSRTVLPPWTPLLLEKAPGVSAQMTQRRYAFGEAIFPTQIEAKGAKLLAGAISLQAQAGGSPVAWKAAPLEVGAASEVDARLSQTLQGGVLEARVSGVLEYDGYLLYDCEVSATKAVELESLSLEIPLHSRHAALCSASFVYPRDPKRSMSESYWDAVTGDLDFRAAPSIWIGDNERGFTFQVESAEGWRNRDPQQAIRVRPRGETTGFTVQFVDQPTRLAAGEKLHYRFAILATPVKPMVRDAWDLRVMRSGPYGRELELPSRTFEGKPQLKYLADLGVRNLYWHIATANWPWPMPGNAALGKEIREFNRAAREAGIKTNPYAIHIRFPIGVEEFDIYGSDIIQMPYKPSAWGSRAPVSLQHPRPGPYAFIADTQVCVQFCPKSPAAQDAYTNALERRLREYGDSGVYLDGSAQSMPCSNEAHGCGYVDAQGVRQPTYPVFANREFIRRIYTVVKTHDPEAVVDLHYWSPNPAQAAYSDINFTGEQWFQLKFTGAGRVIEELPLARFRSMFMGYQVGTPTDLMSYRLGSTRRVAAVSLLHDTPVRLNQGGRSLEDLAGEGLTDGSLAGSSPAGLERVVEDAEYFKLMTRLWKVRDEFGTKEARRLFYWENANEVSVAPKDAYTTIFHHPRNGVLALVSNLTADAAEVKLRFDLDALGLSGPLEAFDPLSGKPYAVSERGEVAVPLASEDWLYLWLRPVDSGAAPQTANTK